MATKTLTITEDAYDILRTRKQEKESFSDVIKREFGSRSLWELVGILSEEEADELEKNIMASRKRARKRTQKIAQELK